MSIDKFKNTINKSSKNIVKTTEFINKKCDDQIKKNNMFFINTIYFILTFIAIIGIYTVMDIIVECGYISILFLVSEFLIWPIIMLFVGGISLVLLDFKQIQHRNINLFVYLIFLGASTVFLFVGNFYIGILFKLFLGIILGAIIYRVVYFIVLFIKNIRNMSNIIIKIFDMFSNIFIGKK